MFSTSPLPGRQLSQRQLAEIVKRQTSSLREGGADRSKWPEREKTNSPPIPQITFNQSINQ